MKTYLRVVLSAVLVGAVAGVLIVSIGDDGATTAQRPPLEASRSPAPSAPAVPDLAGEPLEQAEGELDDLAIDHRAVGGGLFGIIDRSAWEVCATQPPAGREAPGEVRLFVARPGQC